MANIGATFSDTSVKLSGMPTESVVSLLNDATDFAMQKNGSGWTDYHENDYWSFITNALESRDNG